MSTALQKVWGSKSGTTLLFAVLVLIVVEIFARSSLIWEVSPRAIGQTPITIVDASKSAVPNPEVVFMGNSTMMYGVSPDAFEKSYGLSDDTATNISLGNGVPRDYVMTY